MYKEQSLVVIATIERRSNMLRSSIDSLIDQVGLIYVYLNDYSHKHNWMIDYESKYENINFTIGKMCLGDLGDAGKFILFNYIKDKFYFSADDDIIYPNDYVQKTISTMQSQNIKVLSYHGRRFGDQSLPIKGYLRDTHPDTKRIHFNGGNDHGEFVHAIGTGVSCFDKASLKDIKLPTDLMYHSKRNISDVWVSTHLLKSGIIPYIPSFNRSWIRINHTQNPRDTIFNDHLKDDVPRDFFNEQMEGYTLPLCLS